MNILALDPAKLCGFSHTDGTRGCWDLGESKYALLRLNDLLHSFVAEHSCDIIAAENAQQGSPNFYIQGVHAEYRAVIRLCAQQIGADFVLVGPSQLKAWAAGHGRATKEAMQRAAQLHYQVRIEDHNEADAFLCMHYVSSGQHRRAAEAKAALKKPNKTRRKKEAKKLLF